MKLSILIINWNTGELLRKCLASILKHKPDFDFEIIVLDNASSDDSAKRAREVYFDQSEIKFIFSRENLGFAKGNNEALKHASGEHIFLLNPDTEVYEQTLQSLVEFMSTDEQIGVVGPKLNNPDKSLQSSVRSFPDLHSSLLVFSGLHRFFRPKHYLMDNFDYEQIKEVDQVMGAALMTRRSIIQDLGLFDENFHLWYEEVDFCLRVKQAGYKVMYYPNSQVMHHTAQSFSQLAIYKRKKTVANSLRYYFKKNRPERESMAINLVVPLILSVAWIYDRVMRIFNLKPRPKVS